MISHPHSIKLINEITQPLTFADYMNLVLYHPHYGYYSSGQGNIGLKGDYITSATLSSDFGELLALQFLDIWENLDHCQPFFLVEMGAGTGILAKNILTFLKKNHPQLIVALQYIIIEISDTLIQQQRETLQDLIAENIVIDWKTWEQIPDNSIVGCFFSNELLDAFPVHRVVKTDQQLKEIYVKVNNNKLEEFIDNLSTPRLFDYFRWLNIDLLSPAYPQGYQTEVNLAALDWLILISRKLQKGYILTIDYGYSAEKYYHPQRYQGTLTCYYQQRYHHNPYVNIGYQDMTAHVNFTALEKQGNLLGITPEGLTQQGLFLMALGLGDKLRELSETNLNLSELFRRREELHQLINPSGLGGFGVFIQAKGMSYKNKKKPLKGLQDI